VSLDAPTPEERDRNACRALVDDLPAEVADQPRRETDPAEGWGAAWGDPPIVLSCGGPPPAGFGRASSCTTVNGVDWYLPEDQLEPGGDAVVVMTTVNRAQHVEVRMPGEYWPPAATLVDLSAPVSEHTAATGECL
jgi:hypothetical protein